MMALEEKFELQLDEEGEAGQTLLPGMRGNGARER